MRRINLSPPSGIGSKYSLLGNNYGVHQLITQCLYEEEEEAGAASTGGTVMDEWMLMEE